VQVDFAAVQEQLDSKSTLLTKQLQPAARNAIQKQ